MSRMGLGICFGLVAGALLCVEAGAILLVARGEPVAEMPLPFRRQERLLLLAGWLALAASVAIVVTWRSATRWTTMRRSLWLVGGAFVLMAAGASSVIEAIVAHRSIALDGETLWYVPFAARAATAVVLPYAVGGALVCGCTLLAGWLAAKRPADASAG